MSALLESLLTGQQRTACAANDRPALRPFIVQIKRGAAIRLTFEAMGVDALAVAEQHENLCEDFEYVNVRPRVDAVLSPSPDFVRAVHRREMVRGH